MGPRKFGFAPGGNNGDKYGISDVNRREYRDMVMRKYHENSAKSNSKITEPKIENAIAENKVNVAEENNIEANSPKVENAAGNMKSEKVDYIDWPDWRLVVGYGEKEDRQAEAEDEIADVNNAEISELKDEPIVEDVKSIVEDAEPSAKVDNAIEDVKPVVEDARLSAKELAAIWAESLEAQRLARENYTEDVKPIVEDAKPITEDVNSENQNTMQPDKAREEYYARKHEERAAQLAQFRMNEYKEKTGEQVDKNEIDRKLELRHQFDQIKLETDTFLKMQAGLGLMNEKEIRDYKDNLNKQEKNALEYMREGGDGSLAPMENLMKRSLDQISVFEANIQATPEYQEMERKKALVKKGLDAIKERRGNDAELGVNDFHFKEKAYKMQANLAEREFLAKAFSAEDKKNTNEALNAATEKFNKLDEEAIKLTRELKAGGRKLTFEDYQKIDAAWGASAAAEAKVNEIKNADKKEIAFDFAKNQYEKVHKGEQMNGVEGSFLSKFNVLTGEDTIEKFEPTVKDKMGGVAAGMTNPEGEPKDDPKGGSESESKDEPKGGSEGEPKDEPKGGSESDPKGGSEGEPKDEPKDDHEGEPKGGSEGEPKDGHEGEPKGDTESDPKDDPEKDKKKGLVANVIDKIKKHGDGIKKFLLAGAIAVTAGILAYGGYKLATNQNTAVEQGMDKDNNGDTDGNVAEALEKHDASGETDGSENEKLNETVSYNVIVDGVEKTVELSNEVDTSAPEFTNPNRHLNDFGYMDMSKLKEMKEQGASEEAMGFEAMNMLNEALRNPHILANTGANLGVFGDIDSYEDVNEITNMIQNGDDESRAAIRHEVNEALAEFWNGATPKIGTLKAGTPYESCFATQVGGDGNFQINIARDMNGVVHDHDVFYLYGEKDGQDIFNKNELGGIKEKMMKKLGVIKATDNADVRMAKMESGHCIVLEECSGQDGYVLDVKDVPVLHFNQEKTHVDVTPTNTPENTETNNDKPAPKNETSAPKPKNETPPAPTPNENPKTPETNVNDGKTNTASANEDDIKLGEVVKEAGFTNREGTNDLNVQTNLPGSEVTDKAQFDAMVKESIEQNSNPNTTWTFQDNSQGIVHQEGVATEKQADAENRSVLPPETRPEQSTPEGSVSAGDKTSTAEDKDGLMSAAKSDNTTAHESGQTRTVETSVSE